MIKKLFRFDERGMTLVELVIAMSIMTIILGGSYDILANGYSQWNYNSERIGEYQQARSGMVSMVHELRYSTQVVNTGPYPTNNYSISVYGIAVANKTLSTSDNISYTNSDGPWLSTAAVIVQVNGIIRNDYTVNYVTGVITFTAALPGGSLVKADYTRDAYLRYYLSGTDLIRTVNGGSPRTVSKYVINESLTTPIFTWTPGTNLVSVKLIIDKDTTKMPKEYTLDSKVRLRV